VSMDTTPHDDRDGPRGPTGLKAVARAAGVSVSTVSNVLNSTGRFSEETRERVEEAMREVGFVRNRSAFELRTRERGVLGIVIPDLSNAFFARMVRGVVDGAADHGLLVVVSDSADDQHKETAHLAALAEQQVEDVVVLPVRGAAAVLASLDRPVPARLVFIDASAPEGWCAVASDDRAGGAMVLDHLADAGARRIGYVAPTRDTVTSMRFAGASAQAQRRNVAFEWFATDGTDIEAGVAAAERMVADGMPFDAVATANDLVGIGMLRVFRERGVAVPGDVMVVGYDDLERSVDLPVPLSTVRQPTEALGHVALDMLLSERTAQNHTHAQRVLQPELIVRQSSRR